MVVHLVKLCVGVETVEQLAVWQSARREARDADPSQPPIGHVTRMTPKRRDEIVAGGSLYWVIKGSIQVRQEITEIENLVDAEGIKRCRLVLGRDLILTRPHPRRPFQGWRYLKAEDAPADLGEAGAMEGDLPEDMRRELDAMGLL
jgi:hypothetical protein